MKSNLKESDCEEYTYEQLDAAITIAIIEVDRDRRRRANNGKTHMCGGGDDFVVAHDYSDCSCNKRRSKAKRPKASEPKEIEVTDTEPKKVVTDEEYLQRQVGRREGLQKAYERSETDPGLRERYVKYLDRCFE